MRFPCDRKRATRDPNNEKWWGMTDEIQEFLTGSMGKAADCRQGIRFSNWPHARKQQKYGDREIRFDPPKQEGYRQRRRHCPGLDRWLARTAFPGEARTKFKS
jgi:hypothetical protein